MAKKSDLEILKPSKRTVQFKDKEYIISELTTELGLSLAGFLGQVDFTTQGKVKELLKTIFEKSQNNPGNVDEFIKDFIAHFCDFVFSFINKHTRDYFYEFIAIALSNDDKEFTVEDAKKLKLKESIKVLSQVLFDEDTMEFLQDAFFPQKGAEKARS
jgi:hypothetical protein